MTPVALLVVHNLLTNLSSSDRWYVRVNLTTAVAVLAVAGGCRGLRLTGPGVAAGVERPGPQSGDTAARGTKGRVRVTVIVDTTPPAYAPPLPAGHVRVTVILSS